MGLASLRASGLSSPRHCQPECPPARASESLTSLTVFVSADSFTNGCDGVGANCSDEECSAASVVVNCLENDVGGQWSCTDFYFVYADILLCTQVDLTITFCGSETA